jgi:hypothetical protein
MSSHQLEYINLDQYKVVNNSVNCLVKCILNLLEISYLIMEFIKIV